MCVHCAVYKSTFVLQVLSSSRRSSKRHTVTSFASSGDCCHLRAVINHSLVDVDDRALLKSAGVEQRSSCGGEEDTSSESGDSALDRLSDKLLLFVFDHLSIIDRIRVERVCKRFLELANMVFLNWHCCTSSALQSWSRLSSIRLNAEQISHAAVLHPGWLSGIARRYEEKVLRNTISSFPALFLILNETTSQVRRARSKARSQRCRAPSRRKCSGEYRSTLHNLARGIVLVSRHNLKTNCLSDKSLRSGSRRKGDAQFRLTLHHSTHIHLSRQCHSQRSHSLRNVAFESQSAHARCTRLSSSVWACTQGSEYNTGEGVSTQCIVWHNHCI